MPYYAIGETTNNILTVQQVVFYPVAADAPNGSVNVDDIIVNGDSNAIVDRRINIANLTNLAFVEPTQQEADAQLVIERKLRVHVAARVGYANNLPHWTDIDTSSENTNGRRAVNKWIFHGSAGLDLMIDGNFRNRAGNDVIPTNIEEILETWEGLMSSGIQTWYDNGLRTYAGSWAGIGLSGSIYMDTVDEDAVIRDADGTFVTVNNNVVPANFTTETTNLRKS